MPISPVSTGYITEVPYPRSFVPQITAPTLRLVAALNGHVPPPDDEFDYCELGSACGDTLTTLAASNPGARFVGVELSAQQVAVAKARAERGGLQNVRFVDRDFACLGEGDDLPLFDFIVAHGIWTWVAKDKREAALAFVRSFLKPGGLFYVSYNAFPGWAAVEPLRRLMQKATGGSPMTPLERARTGVELAQRLSDSGAAYFGQNPTARSMLALIQKAGLPYAVHEYFHADWEPMYFADVARSMEASGLSYLGQVPLYNNVKELAIPPSLKKTSETVKDRIALEELKDFATNEMFRSDVYVKGKLVRSPTETRYYFEGTPFGTLAPLASIKREARLPFYTIEYKEPVYESILSIIATRRSTAMELAVRPELAQAGQLRLGDCLQSLVLGGQVVPMRPVAPSDAPSGAGGLRLSAYNALVLDEGLAEEGPLVLASPVTGSGVHLSILEGLALRLLTDATLSPSKYPDAVKEYARARPMPLAVGERRIKDGDELAKVMAREVERFRSGALPKLLELGVVVGEAVP